MADLRAKQALKPRNFVKISVKLRIVKLYLTQVPSLSFSTNTNTRVVNLPQLEAEFLG